MKKMILSLIGATFACTTFAANCVSVQQIGTDYTNHQITIAITRAGCTGDATNHRNTVWVFVDYREAGGSVWTRATISAASAGTVVNSGSSKGVWVYGANGTQTITLTLSGMPAKYDWCAFATDYPPNATNTNGGIYALKGSKPLVVNGATSVTGDTYSGMINTLTDATGCPGMIQYNFSYTGSAQSITLTAGTYDMECWGAQGGDDNDGIGGRGGYTKGTTYLKENTTMSIFLGNGTGQLFNGGWSSVMAGYGGGATDIRLTGSAWNNTADLRSRIMVAGGGGGAEDSRIHGGYAGGLVGANGTGGAGGSQTSGSSFGGGGISNSIWGGGGGGYYTGTNGACYACSGAGGSSFISGHNGCNAVNASGAHTGQANHYSGHIFTNTVMIDGGGYSWTTARGAQVRMPNPSGGSYSLGAGNSGNGYVRITRISN